MPMRDGAVAFIDALGFKGIWEREDPDTVLEKLKSTELVVTQFLKKNRFITESGNLELKAIFFSDSIIFFCWPRTVKETTEEIQVNAMSALAAVTYAAGAAAGHALKDPCPLAYRGK